MKLDEMNTRGLPTFRDIKLYITVLQSLASLLQIVLYWSDTTML